MAEGVIADTWQEAKAHPYWIVGGVVGLVLLLWLFSGSKAKSAPQNFTFSYGPSTAQIQAGTQLAIAQQADQTAVSLAQIQATSQQQTANSYFGYLATHSADQLKATINTNEASKYRAAAAMNLGEFQAAAASNTAQFQTAANQNIAYQGYATQLAMKH